MFYAVRVHLCLIHHVPSTTSSIVSVFYSNGNRNNFVVCTDICILFSICGIN